MGGRTAILLSALQPLIVDKLIVVDASPIQPTTPQGINAMETFLEAVAKVDLKFLSSENMDRASIKKFLDQSLKENGIKNESRRQWLMMALISRNEGGIEGWYDWQFNLKVLQQTFRTNLICVPQDAMKNDACTKETLFIGSGQSNYIPRDSHDDIRKIFPLAKFVYVEGASHWVQTDKPKEFLQIVHDFLGSSDESPNS